MSYKRLLLLGFFLICWTTASGQPNPTQANSITQFIQEVRSTRTQLDNQYGRTGALNGMETVLQSKSIPRPLHLTVWVTDHLSAPWSRTRADFYDSHLKKLIDSQSAFSRSSDRESDLVYLRRGMIRWRNLDREIKSVFRQRSELLVKLALYEEENRRLAREEFSYSGPQRRRYDEQVARLDSLRKSTYQELELNHKFNRVLQKTEAFSALDATTRVPVTLHTPSNNSEEDAKVEEITILDEKGRNRRYLCLGEKFHVEVRFDQRPRRPGKLTLLYPQGQREFALQQLEENRAKTATLTVGPDLPVPAGSTFKAARDESSASAEIESNIFARLSYEPGRWWDAPANWADEAMQPHQRNPGMSQADLVGVMRGDVTLDTPAQVESLVVDKAGKLQIKSELEAGFAKVKNLLIESRVRIQGKLAIDGPVEWNSGSLSCRELEIEPEGHLKIDGQGQDFSIIRIGNIKGKITSQGVLKLKGGTGSRLVNHGQLELAKQTRWEGRSIELRNNGKISADAALLELPFVQGRDGELTITEHLGLFGGGTHKGGKYSGAGSLRLKGTHNFSSATKLACPLQQLDGAIKATASITLAQNSKLIKGSLTSESPLKVDKEVRQEAEHTLKTSGGGGLEISEEGDVVLKGGAELSKLFNDGYLEFAGPARKLKVKSLDSPGEFVLGKGIELTVEDCKQLEQFIGNMGRPLLEASLGGRRRGALMGATWDIAGTFKVERPGQRAIPINFLGPQTSVTLRKGASLPGIDNQSFSRTLYNSGQLTLDEGAEIKLGLFSQDAGRLHVVKGARMTLGVGSQSRFGLLQVSDGWVVIDGEVLVYDADGKTLDDRRILFGSLRLTGAGTINGKTVDHFGGTKTNPLPPD